MIYRDNAVFDKYDKFVCPFKNSFCGYFRVVGYCNGVICLIDDQYTYKQHYTFLWNPSIRKCVFLPDPRVTFHTHGPYDHDFGFGYDDTSNDYKIVRIVHLQSSKMPSEVDVYRLGTRTWHNITHLGLLYKIDHKAPQVYLNGASHWLAYDKKTTHHVVVAFVLADEVFRYIEAPATGRMNLLMQPCDYHGSLAVIECIGYGSNETWSIWVMKNYGATNSWTKQFSISGFSGFDCLLVAIENDEEIFASAAGELMCHYPGWGTYMFCLESVICFRETGDVLFGLLLGYILAYRSRTGFKKLELHGLERPYFPLFATSYRESIALIGNQGHVLPGAKTGEEDQKKEKVSAQSLV